jgi:hypothetical protein
MTSLSHQWRGARRYGWFDAYYYLYSSWNKVDIFYLSDSNGVPLEESPIFEGYGFHSYPVEIRGGTVVQKTWAFD